MSFEINNDTESERFRDQISKALAGALGADLQYGRWTVHLRTDHHGLSVRMTGPDVREEWAFGRADTRDPTDLAEQLRRRFLEARRTT
jgi:hypothetical protein